MSTTRRNQSDSKNSESKNCDKQFKKATSAMVGGANYALSASGASNLFITALGLAVTIPALVFWVVPAAIGLIFCSVGVYRYSREPDREEEMEHKLDEIKEGIEHVILDRQQEMADAKQIPRRHSFYDHSLTLFDEKPLVELGGASPPSMSMDEVKENKPNVRGIRMG